MNLILWLLTVISMQLLGLKILSWLTILLVDRNWLSPDRLTSWSLGIGHSSSVLFSVCLLCDFCCLIPALKSYTQKLCKWLKPAFYCKHLITIVHIYRLIFWYRGPRTNKKNHEEKVFLFLNPPCVNNAGVNMLRLVTCNLKEIKFSIRW